MPIQLNPYLNFNGTAAKAIAHYEKALGAKVEQIMRFSDAPGIDASSPHKDWVMHAALRIEGNPLMVSDSMPDQPVSSGNNVSVCLNFTDVADMKKRFDALGAGGTITVPVAEQFWGATFGMLIDAFGVQWMFNCETKR